LQGKTEVDFIERLRVLAKDCLSQENNASISLPFLTNFTRPAHFVGRQDELETLHTHLQTALPTVIVNGIGGVGKTTLVRKYVFDKQAHYAHIVWLEQSSTVINAFIFNERLTAGKDFGQQNELTRFQDIIKDLESRQGNNLLVIDNYALTETDSQLKALAYLRDIHFQHWRVLFTSREQVQDFTPMRLGTLPEDKAIELFCTYIHKERIDETQLKELLKLIDYHTLTIELLAKTYYYSLDLENLGQLTDILRKNALDAEKLNKNIQIGDSIEEKQLYQHLNTIFNISLLEEDALYILKQFAVLPPLPIAGKDFLAWILPTNAPTATNTAWVGKFLHWVGKRLGFGTKSLPTIPKAKPNYETTLQNLAKKGWLTYATDKTFEMHRLMQMFLLSKCKPTIADCEPLYDSLMDLLTMDKVQANPLANQWLLVYGESFLEGIIFEAQPLWKVFLQNNLATLYKFLGIYTQAEQLYQACLHSVKEILGTKDERYATILNNLAGLHRAQGKYMEAESLYQEALQIGKETIGKKHPHYAIRLNNLALLYYAQGKYAEVEPLYQEALQIDEETIGKKHPHYAMRLNNLASLYNVQGKYAEAEPLFQEALQIGKETIGKKHPDYAIRLSNLASLYSNQGKYAEAEFLYQEALQITAETVGKLSPAYATHLNNLGSIYYEMGQYTEAKGLLAEACDIFVSTLGEKHPDTQSAKEWLRLTNKKL
jgi:tetratricopeptide (TPR) repeat protein